MRFVLLMLASFAFTSCGTIIDITECNTCGVVISSKEKRKTPYIKYLLLIDPEEKVYGRLYSLEKFNINDTVCVRSQSYKLTPSK